MANKTSDSTQLIDTFVTFFGVGRSKFCPGTFGSIATLPLWIFGNMFLVSMGISNIASVITFWVVFIGLIFFAGIKASDEYLKRHKKEGDPQEIVIDEVVGQLLALLSALIFHSQFVVEYAAVIGEQTKSVGQEYMSGFMLMILPIIMFRIFDIKKPYLIGKCDENIKGGLGVMLDDLVAGIFASISLAFLYFIYYGYIIN